MIRNGISIKMNKMLEEVKMGYKRAFLSFGLKYKQVLVWLSFRFQEYDSEVQ